VIGTIIILKIVDLTIGVRVSGEDEMVGLDLSQHGEEGYNLDMDLGAASQAGGSYGSPAYALSGQPIAEKGN
jgi:Amt family ammonium transporter